MLKLNSINKYYNTGTVNEMFGLNVKWRDHMRGLAAIAAH